MTSSLVFWGVLAVLLFWSVGAYNRLVRLRSEANAAFGALDAELTRQVALVHQCVGPAAAAPVSQFDGTGFWHGLEGAAGQLTASLTQARARPLEPDRIAALDAALQVLAMAWERVERDDAHDLAGSRLPADLIAERAQSARQARTAGEQFNAAVANYNEAIAQFPAVLLAYLFGFKPGLGVAAVA
jgi:LemA protein